jgi:hypothetical protein
MSARMLQRRASVTLFALALRALEAGCESGGWIRGVDGGAFPSDGVNR